MKNLRFYQCLAALCCLCAFLSMTASVVYSCVLSRDTMYSGFLLYSRTEHLGVGAERYGEYAQGITEYLAGHGDLVLVPGEDGVSRPAFGEKENLHMEDVRQLIRLLSAVRLGTGALFLGLAAFLYLKARKAGPSLLRGAALGAGLWLLLGAGLTAAALSGFDSFFIGFHRLFFDNNLWLLNPATDLLIRVCPQSMFAHMGARVGVISLAGIIAVSAAATALTFIWPKRKEDDTWNNRDMRRASAQKRITFGKTGMR